MPRGIYPRKPKGITPIHKNCLFCKIPFTTDCFMPRKKFCSKSCSSKSHPDVNRANLEKIDRDKQRAVVSSRKGEKHQKWIKDRTVVMEKHRIRGTIEWKEWRVSVFQRDEYTCQECGIKGGKIEPHHIIPLRISFDKIFDVMNGITLCRPCHQKTIHKEEKFQKIYTDKVLTKL